MSVTVSSEYQITIPPEMREQLEILIYDGQLHCMPVEPIESLYGIFKGAEIPYERDKEDRLL